MAVGSMRIDRRQPSHRGAFTVSHDRWPETIWEQRTPQGPDCDARLHLHHAFMPIHVKVVSQEAFAAWVASKGGSMTKAADDAAAAAAAAAPAVAEAPAAPAADAAAAPTDAAPAAPATAAAHAAPAAQ